MIMIHSDDEGLILPPRVAQTQIVIVPILNTGDDKKEMKDKAHEIARNLRKSGLRVAVDDSDVHNPGFKYAYWELRGTPVRLELGKKDFGKQEVRVCVRATGEKYQMGWEGLCEAMVQKMEQIQQGMFDKAKQAREDHTSHVTNWKDFMAALNKRDIVLAPWCDQVSCEEAVKDKSK